MVTGDQATPTGPSATDPTAGAVARAGVRRLGSGTDDHRRRDRPGDARARPPATTSSPSRPCSPRGPRTLRSRGPPAPPRPRARRSIAPIISSSPRPPAPSVRATVTQLASGGPLRRRLGPQPARDRGRAPGVTHQSQRRTATSVHQPDRRRRTVHRPDRRRGRADRRRLRRQPGRHAAPHRREADPRDGAARRAVRPRRRHALAVRSGARHGHHARASSATRHFQPRAGACRSSGLDAMLAADDAARRALLAAAVVGSARAPGRVSAARVGARSSRLARRVRLPTTLRPPRERTFRARWGERKQFLRSQHDRASAWEKGIICNESQAHHRRRPRPPSWPLVSRPLRLTDGHRQHRPVQPQAANSTHGARTAAAAAARTSSATRPRSRRVGSTCSATIRRSAAGGGDTTLIAPGTGQCFCQSSQQGVNSSQVGVNGDGGGDHHRDPRRLGPDADPGVGQHPAPTASSSAAAPATRS